MRFFISKNKVANNAAWIIGARVFQSLISLVIGMLSARYLGPSNYGLINYASSLTAFASPVMRLGINNILVKELVSDKEREGTILGTTLFLNLLSAIVCIIGINGFCYVANAGDYETRVVCMLYSTVLLFQAIEVFAYWFQAHLLSKYSSLVALIGYIVSALYKLFLLISRKSIYWFALTNSIEAFLIAVLQIFLFYRKSGRHLRLSTHIAKQLLSLGKYFIISNMMITIFAQTDRIMLKHMLANDAVGYYSAAITCSTLTGFVFSAIIDSFRPVIFEDCQQDKGRYLKRLKLLYSIIIYVSLAQCTLMTALAHWIIPILYGSKYYPTVPALRIVVWYTTFSYVGAVRSIWIISEHKQKYLWIINLSGTLVNVMLNFLLIPVLGIQGAAVASLITQFFANVLINWIIQPLRENNKIMFDSLNPKNIIGLYKMLTNDN